VPMVKRPDALVKAYNAANKKMDDLPTQPFYDGHTLLRAIDPLSRYSYLPPPASGGHVSRQQANKLLIPADPSLVVKNRFSGPGAGTIRGAAAHYFALQQQALVNELTHYSEKVSSWAVAGRCILRVRVMGRILVADLSPHSPRAMRFFRELGPKVWDEVNDPDDCSVARGIGLAIAHSGYLAGLIAQTVRDSDRSPEEKGDNLVLFAPPGQPVPQLYIDKVYYFGKRSTPDEFPVEFP
jgi:hypothetical protein